MKTATLVNHRSMDNHLFGVYEISPPLDFAGKPIHHLLAFVVRRSVFFQFCDVNGDIIGWETGWIFENTTSVKKALKWKGYEVV